MGWLSDRQGRLKLLKIGLFIYTCGCILSLFAESLNDLIVSRSFQGFGASVGLLFSRSIIIDSYKIKQARQKLSLLTSINASAPVLAPIAGELISRVYGWEGIFFTLAILGTGLLFAAEHLSPIKSLAKPKLNKVTRSKSAIVFSKVIIYYALYHTILGAIYFTLYSTLPAVINIKQLTENSDYNTYYVLVASSIAFGGYLSMKSSHHLEGKNLIIVGGVICVLSEILMLALTSQAPLMIFSLLGLYAFGRAIVAPNLIALVLEENRDYSSTVSSILGSSQLLAASIISQLMAMRLESGLADFKEGLLLATGLQIALLIVIVKYQRLTSP